MSVMLEMEGNVKKDAEIFQSLIVVSVPHITS
jgi:hypothetical protein